MMKRLLCLLAFVCCFGGTSLYATTIFSENFDQIPLAQTGLTLTTAGQFQTINGTNIDVVSAANGWASLVVPPESGNVVDLGGTGGNSFGQLQSGPIAVGPGSYQLSYDLVGSQRGVDTTTLVTVSDSGGTLYSRTFNLASNDDVSGIVIDDLFGIAASDTVYLTFTLLDGANNIGSLLDNVSITATPEPASLLLLGSGLTALAGLVRRFRKA